MTRAKTARLPLYHFGHPDDGTDYATPSKINQGYAERAYSRLLPAVHAVLAELREMEDSLVEVISGWSFAEIRGPLEDIAAGVPCDAPAPAEPVSAASVVLEAATRAFMREAGRLQKQGCAAPYAMLMAEQVWRAHVAAEAAKATARSIQAAADADDIGALWLQTYIPEIRK
jgi:hypothetical protein